MNFEEFIAFHKKLRHDEDKITELLANLVIELHWDFETLKNTPVPFIFQLIDAYKKRGEEYEKETKKMRGMRHGRH